MEEINNFQQEPDETLYQAWEQFKELLMKCPQHYLTEMQEVVLFYNRLDVQTREILDSKGVIPSKTIVDAKVAIQEMVEYSQKWHNGTSRTRSTENFDELVAIQAQLNNLGREIKKVNEKVYAAQVGREQCKGPHYTKDFPLKEEVVENMDGYRDQDMGDIILGEPLCKASCMEARRFAGIITIHNGSDNVTYQMARSHIRFKHLSNAQCNKIKPILKDIAAKKSTKLVKYRSSRILLIMEYLVKISKKARHLELKRRHMKITVMTSNTPYPSRKIRRICACTSLKTTKDQGSIHRIQRSLYAIFKLWK
uniref:Retrotransposon gag domain-containing protein n=1 Tax=Tanacetum cinerariifolium TaxID=118510 RepID=A0A6L2JDC2_TANCI|nr:hypothetical protein [Tanacetum cinerariifolium]